MAKKSAAQVAQKLLKVAVASAAPPQVTTKPKIAKKALSSKKQVTLQQQYSNLSSPSPSSAPPAAAAGSCPSASGITPSVTCSDGRKRCWGLEGALPTMADYHDQTWGRATTCPKQLYAQLVLQSFQSGLSWKCIYNKMGAFESRFESWDYKVVAAWPQSSIDAALSDPGIVRNRLKVLAAVSNARLAASLDASHPGGFAGFLWDVCGSLPSAERLLQYSPASGSHMRSSAREDYDEADGVHPTKGVTLAAKILKERGFKFLGPTTVLSLLQAAGFVNHHKPDCWAWQECEKRFEEARKEMTAERKIKH